MKHRVSKLILLICLSVFSSSSFSAYAYDSKGINAHFIESEMKLDGVLNEAAWEGAIPAADFVQREQTEGEPASEKTEVRIMYDRDMLYIGVICHDSEPDKIVHNAMSRDGFLRSDDNIVVVLDTFRDSRTGFYFQTNQNGASLDGISTAGAYRVDEDWNGLWDAAAKITDDGWCAEMFIPFKTLRFSSESIQTWGINFARDIARKHEETLWTSWKRDDGIRQLSKAGSLTGLENIQRGRQIQYKPFALGGLEYDGEESGFGNTLKYGLDVKYPITPEMTLDLTTFTDFAQVESDRDEINLTRFSLYYPEKRDVFLEGADIFSFGSRYTSPYYSRRIGLNDDGDQIPILGGAKLVGKTGRYNIGVINMQTDEKHGQPSSNYSVVRVKRDIFNQSYIGMIATNLGASGGHSSQAYGADFTLRTDSFMTNKNLEAGGYIAENKIPGVNHGTRAGRFYVRYPNDLLYLYALHHVVGENYEPETGYVRRNGIKQTSAWVTYSPRPDIPLVRNLEIRPLRLSYYTDMNNRLLTRSFSVTPLGIEMTTGDEISFSLEQSYEYIDEEFDIFDETVISVGTYEWWAKELSFRSSGTRPVGLDIELMWGDFYNGERNRAQFELDLRMNEHLSFSADTQFNTIKLGADKFTTREYGGHINVNVSPRLTTRTFVQYNNESEEINLNFRLHYIPKIGSDIYLVYNHLMARNDNFRTIYNTGMSKIAYMLTF